MDKSTLTSVQKVIVAGDVVGDIYASGMVEIKLSGSVLGNIECPRISIVDGAKFRGSIDTGPRAGTTLRLDSPKADSAKMSHSSSLGKLFPRF